ncbi:MAG: DNA-directed RNA polymerase subunit H [Thermoplasmatales archaeon]|jgi:DNA-directed RNA polymerase subunit H (RpoH/RPB5)|nr:MAG: DNA-directed RNA polymerase subunit H [Thermoplasmatales archaeon]
MAKETHKQEFEIMRHDLVPLHEVISEEEKKQLFEDLNITPDQLPKIMDTDPVSISIGAKPGQIVKIVRKSHTANEAVAYRLVVESND